MLKIEDLRINQKVKLFHSEYTEWNEEFHRITGIKIDKDGKENITIDDGTPAGCDGWRLNDIATLDYRWKCKRCKSIVDMNKFRCDCTESPSPWKKEYLSTYTDPKGSVLERP